MSDRGTGMGMAQAMPFAKDAEKGMLSCILHKPLELAPEVIALRPEMVFHPGMRLTLEVMQGFLREGRPVEYIALAEHLRDTGDMDRVGDADGLRGEGFLAALLDFVPAPTHWGYYLGILKDKLYLRTVIERCDGAKQRALEANAQEAKTDAARKVLLEAMADFSELVTESPGGHRKWIHAQESVDAAMLRFEERLRSKGRVMKGAIATGFTDLDRRTQGLLPGELFIIGARPAMGKSALAANMAECMVLANGHYREFAYAVSKGEIGPVPVGVVTLEMGHVDITERILIGRSGADMGKTRTGMFSREDRTNYVRACGELSKAPLYFLDTGRLSVQELLARCRHDVERLGLRVLIVDYLQRMCSDSKRAQQNRNVEIGEISAGLKGIAKDFGLVVIALAQVGRSAEDRAGCKPQMADLRESGDIEADADFVGLLYRPGYYERKKAKRSDGEKKGGRGSGSGSRYFNPDEAEDDAAEEPEDEIADDKAELIMAKCRRGAPEPVELKWDGPRTRFTSTHDRLFSNDDSQREH